MNPRQPIVDSFGYCLDETDPKNLLCDQVLAEYKQRLSAGEVLDPEEFASRFPACASSFLKTLEVESWLTPERLSPVWPSAGEEVLGFRLLLELGRGGFSRVFLAEQPALGGRRVVLKLTPSRHNEAMTLGRLEHRNIVMLHSVGSDDGRGLSVLCMPFLGRATLLDVLNRAFRGDPPPRDAEALRAAVEEAALPPELTGGAPPSRCEAFRTGGYVAAVIDVARQLAEALAYVHLHGIYHRDLKPTNVLLSQDGRPMLLDFNLSDDPDVPRVQFGGTLRYMSPEQLRALAARDSEEMPIIDGRSDLYSLGVVVYELLTGQHPHGIPNDRVQDEQFRQELLARKARGNAPLRGRHPDVDQGLEKIIHRCLAVEPAGRFATADDLVVALRRWQSPARRALRGVSRHRLLASFALAGILAGIALGVYQAQLPSQAQCQFDRGVRAYEGRDFRAAIDAFSGALDQPSAPSDAHYLRGRAYLHLRPPEYRKALDDFLRAEVIATADPVSKEGRGKAVASAAMCYHALSQEESMNFAAFSQKALSYFDKAIEYGFAPAILHNNRGFIQARLKGEIENAARSFTLALQLDPNLQAAYHNRARIDLRRADNYVAKGYVPETGIHDIKEAIRLGPTSPELYYDAFCLFMKAFLANPAKQDYLGGSRNYIRQLADRGWMTRQMAEDAFLQSVRARLGFSLPPVIPDEGRRLPVPVLFLDPVGE
jgi:serine/threonine protein kinase